mgnify:FL=1
MKLSVSLSESDLILLDRCVERDGLASRSAGIQNAIRLLGKADLQDAYAEAWFSWDASEDATVWDSAVADGIDGGGGATR